MALPLESVELPPTDGVDRSRRAAASLVSAWAAQRARDLEIDPAILATRADIEAFLMGDDGRLATGWRHDVVGAPVRALAAGEASLAVDGTGPPRPRRPLGRRLHGRRMTRGVGFEPAGEGRALAAPVAGHLDGARRARPVAG